MDLSGKYSVPGAPQDVWTALHDPAVLAACIPGAESVERTGADEYKAKAVLKIGPVKARFEGKVTLEAKPPPDGFTHAVTLRGQGQGGAAGFAKGDAAVRLAAEGNGTLLVYDARADVGGKLAQIGQRLIDGAAKSLADEFFAKFASELKARAPAPPAIHDAASLVPEAHTDHAIEADGDDEGLAPQIWVVGLILVVVILLGVFGLIL